MDYLSIGYAIYFPQMYIRGAWLLVCSFCPILACSFPLHAVFVFCEDFSSVRRGISHDKKMAKKKPAAVRLRARFIYSVCVSIPPMIARGR